MVNNNKIDVAGLQVVIKKPIWLSSKIWEPRVYDNPPDILVECAKNCFDTPEGETIYFARNGIKFNPFAKSVMVDLTPAEVVEEDIYEEDEVDFEETETDVDIDSDEEVYEEDESEDEEYSNDYDEEDEEEVDSEDFPFKSVIEFSELSKTEQYNYIEEIRNAPEGYEEDEVVEYEIALQQMLIEYLKVVSGVKAKDSIEEVLSEYEE